MVNSQGGAGGAFSIDAQHTQRLRQAVPDLDDWPRSWHVEPADIAVGEQIVQVLMPFLLHLLDQGLAKATISRHRDNLWTLGGELIRCRYDDNALAKKQVKYALCELIEGDGGPLIWPRISESQQDSLDATCRKLRRYWRVSPTQARSE
jgi:hypothetical protein